MQLQGAWIFLVLFVSLFFLVVSNVWLKFHIFLSLLLTALIAGMLSGMEAIETVATMAEGFGSIMESIGIVILLGCILGRIMEKSGAIASIAECILGAIDMKRAMLPTNLMGWLVSIPVFCDSGFVVLSPLANELAKRTDTSKVSYGLALGTGLYASHCLVPPTPGPLAGAAELGVELGLMIPLGVLVSIPASIAGMLYANWIGKRIRIKSEVQEGAPRDHLPGKLGSFMPIIAPLALICSGSFSKFIEFEPIRALLEFLGHPIIALMVGLFFSVLIAPKNREVLGSWVEEGLLTGAIILFVTGAGGSFGEVIRAGGIGDYLAQVVGGFPVWLFLPFAISSILKTFQGSSTVSILTSCAIIAPALPGMGLTSQVALALTVLSAGSGAMVVSHVNDSYFWVVTRLTGIKDLKAAYKTQTAATLVEGFAALSVILLLGVLLL
jgi:GntP family gluconate:H+ symporter